MKKHRKTNQANRRRKLLVNLLVLIMILGLGKTVDAGSICTYEEGSSAEIEYVRTWGCYHNPDCFGCNSILNPLTGDCKNEILINVKVKNTGTKTCWYKAEVYTTGGSLIYFIADGEIEPGNARTFARDTSWDGGISTEQFSDRYITRIFVCTESGWLGIGCSKWVALPPTTAKEVCCGACSCDKDGQHGVDCVGGCEASCECDGKYPGGSACGSNCYPVGETPPTPIQPCSQGVCESENTFPPACKCGDPEGEETEDGKGFCCASLGKVFTDKASCDASCTPCPYGACEGENTEPFPCTCGGLDGEDTYEGSLFCCASLGKVFATKTLCDTSCTPTPPPEIPEEEIEYTNEYRGCGDTTYWEDCHCGGCCCDCEGAEGCGMHCKWKSRIEQKTDLIDIPRTVVQHITIPKVSHEDILDNTKITVTEVIDQYVDEWGSRRIYGILNVTLEPDILSEFLYVVNDSAIIYSPMFYPVKHHLYRKNLGPGPATRQYNYSDNYGFESVEEYEFLQECKRTCPPSISSVCQCTPEDRTDVTCQDISTGEEYYPNKDSDPDNDCVCVENDCYPNPCESKRDFHEDQGLRIRNGDFERAIGYCCPHELLQIILGECQPKRCDDCHWPSECRYAEHKNWAKVAGDVDWVSNGFSGYCVKLENDGWMRQRIAPVPMPTNPYHELCFMYGLEKCESEGNLTLFVNGEEKFRIECDSYATPCDLPSGWHSECVSVEENLSSIDFVSHNMRVYIDSVSLGSFYDFTCMETVNFSSMTKHLDMPPKDYNKIGVLDVINVKPSPSETGTTYTVEFSVLQNTLTADEFMNSNVTIYSYFRNITVDLSSSSTRPNLEVKVLIRKPTRLTYSMDKEPYMLTSGKSEEVTLKLVTANPGEPIEGVDIHLTTMNGVAEINGKSEDTVSTGGDGTAPFSVSIKGEDVIVGSSEATDDFSSTYILIPVASQDFRSPFFRGDFLASFLILILILVFIILSFHLFSRKRMDFDEWWKTLKGEK